jgi:hypothetical protein
VGIRRGNQGSAEKRVVYPYPILSYHIISYTIISNPISLPYHTSPLPRAVFSRGMLSRVFLRRRVSGTLHLPSHPLLFPRLSLRRPSLLGRVPCNTSKRGGTAIAPGADYILPSPPHHHTSVRHDLIPASIPSSYTAKPHAPWTLSSNPLTSQTQPSTHPFFRNSATCPPADTVSPGLTSTFSTRSFAPSAAATAASGVLTAISSFIASRMTICRTSATPAR